MKNKLKYQHVFLKALAVSDVWNCTILYNGKQYTKMLEVPKDLTLDFSYFIRDLDESVHLLNDEVDMEYIMNRFGLLTVREGNSRLKAANKDKKALERLFGSPFHSLEFFDDLQGLSIEV